MSSSCKMSPLIFSAVCFSLLVGMVMSQNDTVTPDAVGGPLRCYPGFVRCGPSPFSPCCGPSSTRYCANEAAGLCCPLSQVASLGGCCPRGSVNAQGQCCPAGEVNTSGICCPPGEVNCGGNCCKGTCRVILVPFDDATPDATATVAAEKREYVPPQVRERAVVPPSLCKVLPGGEVLCPTPRAYCLPSSFPLATAT
jgi:hypothetical protein